MTPIILAAIVAGAAIVVLILLGIRLYAAGMAERKLIARVGPERAESLMAFEKTKEPGITRSTAARRAWERWEYDQAR